MEGRAQLALRDFTAIAAYAVAARRSLPTGRRRATLRVSCGPARRMELLVDGPRSNSASLGRHC